MSNSLLISVRILDGRYHGANESHPSPARLFQALVAGVGISGPLKPDDIAALSWLEKKSEAAPPVVGVPRMLNGQEVVNFVPNNDLDAKQGDRRNIGAIRTKKRIRPKLFDASTPFLFCWDIEDEDSPQVERICSIAEKLYQFGRGVDFAWAIADVLPREEAYATLSDYRGLVLRPTIGGRGTVIPCPIQGSLKSLTDRHAAYARRFNTVVVGKTIGQNFKQPPKPRFRQVSYASPPSRQLFELRQQTARTPFTAWELSRVVFLVEMIRDAAVLRLKEVLPQFSSQIELHLVGRADDSDERISTADRVRIVPIPSIGSSYVDQRIRRLLVEIPANCKLRSDDLFWAFAGLTLDGNQQGIDRFSVVRTTDLSMLKHFGSENSKSDRTWRSVTPVALPENASRRRIDPQNISAEAKAGLERRREQLSASAAVIQALRHARVETDVVAVKVQREPFDANGQRAESFAPQTRFAKERLWHVEVEFAQAPSGPMVIGDGRFLGLGLMVPKCNWT